MTNPKPKKSKDNSLAARRERALKRQESAAQTLRSLAEEERKKRTQRLVKLGAPVDLAGLGAWHEDTLLGAMLALKGLEGDPKWAERETAWREAGAAFRAERKAVREAKKARVPVVVEFPRAFDGDSEEDKQTRAALRDVGLRWVKQVGLWVGDVDLDEAYEIVTVYGGVLERRDGVPNAAVATAGDAEPERVH